MCGSFGCYLCAIICPPIAVLCRSGCTCDFLINILLTCAFLIPGMCHACYVIGKEDDKKRSGGHGVAVNVYANNPV